LTGEGERGVGWGRERVSLSPMVLRSFLNIYIHTLYVYNIYMALKKNKKNKRLPTYG
jgi:hypothetical protein